MPPPGHWPGDAIGRRQLDSLLVPSALKFAVWSVLPVEHAWYSSGLARLTADDELPKLVRLIDEGRPAVLGLIVADDLVGVARNHQVLAYGYEVDASGSTTVLVDDSNAPGRATRLAPHDDGWHSSTGEVWRGFFVHDYTPRTPPLLAPARVPPTHRVRSGEQVRLTHAWTGRTLGVVGPTSAPAPATVGPGSPDEAGTWWTVVRRDDGAPAQPGPMPRGAPLRHGDLVRLQHATAGVWLRSRRGTRSPVTAQQAVTCTDGPPTAACDWRVEVDGRAAAWTAGARVRLVHVATDAALHSHGHPLPGARGHEVTAFAGRDGNDWWTLLAARPAPA